MTGLSAEQAGLDVKPGIAHLRQLVAQRTWTDPQAFGRFFAAAALGALFFALAVMYIVRTLKAAARELRGS